MTNQDLIIATALEYNLYTKEEIEQIINEKGELSLHTLIGWQQRSPAGYEYRIKKGEHGLATKLWKKKKSKKDDIDSDTYYLVKSYLFTEQQVELISINENM